MKKGEIAQAVNEALSVGARVDRDLVVSSMYPSPYENDSLKFSDDARFVVPGSYKGIPVRITIEPRRTTP